jgi:hypothetical protein
MAQEPSKRDTQSLSGDIVEGLKRIGLEEEADKLDATRKRQSFTATPPGRGADVTARVASMAVIPEGETPRSSTGERPAPAPTTAQTQQTPGPEQRARKKASAEPKAGDALSAQQRNAAIPDFVDAPDPAPRPPASDQPGVRPQVSGQPVESASSRGRTGRVTAAVRSALGTATAYAQSTWRRLARRSGEAQRSGDALRSGDVPRSGEAQRYGEGARQAGTSSPGQRPGSPDSRSQYGAAGDPWAAGVVRTTEITVSNDRFSQIQDKDFTLGVRSTALAARTETAESSRSRSTSPDTRSRNHSPAPSNASKMSR